jgi:hypothetical protein
MSVGRRRIEHGSSRSELPAAEGKTKEAMEMNGTTKVMAMAGKGLLAAAIATGSVLGAGASDAQAAMSDSSLVCGQGTETAYIGFPLDSAPRMAIYAYRVNGGSWRYTDWYWMARGSYWSWNANAGRWVSLPADVSMKILTIGDRQHVEAWEWRVESGAGRWVQPPMTPCTTTSFFNGGITYTYN